MVIKFIKSKLSMGKKPMDEATLDHKKELIKRLVDTEEKIPIQIKTSVKDIMSTDLKTLKPDDNIGYVLELFSEYSITGAPVIDKGKVVGIVSETDIIRLMNERRLFDTVRDEVKLFELQQIKVKEFMSKSVYFINQDEKLTDASKLMADKRIHRLLVLDNKKKLVGIITMEDVIMGLSAEFFVDSIQKATDKVIESEIDTLLKIIEKKGVVKIDELVREMNLKHSHIENLAKILEKRGLINIEYSLFGVSTLRLKK